MRWDSGYYQSNVSLKALRDHIHSNAYGTTNYNHGGGGIDQPSSNISLNSLTTSNSTYIRIAVRMYQESYSQYGTNNNGAIHIFTWVNSNVTHVRQSYGGKTHTQSRGNQTSNIYTPPVDTTDWNNMKGGTNSYPNCSQVLSGLNSAFGSYTLSYSFNSGSTYYNVTIPNVTVGYNADNSYWNNSTMNNSGTGAGNYSRMRVENFT